MFLKIFYFLPCYLFFKTVFTSCASYFYLLHLCTWWCWRWCWCWCWLVVGGWCRSVCLSVGRSIYWLVGWLLVVGCWLLVVGCWLLAVVVGCGCWQWLLVVGSGVGCDVWCVVHRNVDPCICGISTVFCTVCTHLRTAGTCRCMFTERETRTASVGSRRFSAQLALWGQSLLHNGRLEHSVDELYEGHHPNVHLGLLELDLRDHRDVQKPGDLAAANPPPLFSTKSPTASASTISPKWSPLPRPDLVQHRALGASILVPRYCMGPRARSR